MWPFVVGVVVAVPVGEGAILEAMVCVSWPSPQPMSRILSPGWGSRYWRTFVVRRGTKFAAAAYLVADQWSGFSGVGIFSGLGRLFVCCGLVPVGVLINGDGWIGNVVV
jgi:hypothetical protein